MFDWVTGFIDKTGYLAIGLLMLAENIFPPIPSELIMPLAGFTAARGDLDVFLTVLVGSAGSLLGSTLWYLAGRLVGIKGFAARHGRWLTIAPEDVDDACAWFNRHGAKAVFIGRLVPADADFGAGGPVGDAAAAVSSLLGCRNRDLDGFSCRSRFPPRIAIPESRRLAEPRFERRAGRACGLVLVSACDISRAHPARAMTPGRPPLAPAALTTVEGTGRSIRLVCLEECSHRPQGEPIARNAAMKGVISVLLGTMAYVMVGIALASLS